MCDLVYTFIGMIRELLTEYGPIYRLWWDHYLDGCGGLSECPGGFPAAWSNFTTLVRTISPHTLMGTGPDVQHSLNGESGNGSYPIWNNRTGFEYFMPVEADATIQNPGDRWFWHPNASYWNAKDIWTHFFLTWGIN